MMNNAQKYNLELPVSYFVSLTNKFENLSEPIQEAERELLMFR